MAEIPDMHVNIRASTTPDLYRDVQEFNRKCLPGMVDNTAWGWPHTPGADSRHLGAKLMLEEFIETMNALRVYFEVETSVAFGVELDDCWLHDEEEDIDHLGAVDGIIDLIYVSFGMLLRLGLTPEQFYRAWAEVRRANLDKATGPLRADGKRLKPEGWRPPNIEAALAEPAALDATDWGQVSDDFGAAIIQLNDAIRRAHKAGLGVYVKGHFVSNVDSGYPQFEGVIFRKP